MEKLAASMLFKDVEEVYGRLFNHHPVISGEINYFLKEFEDNRKDREVERLFQVLERTTELRELHLDKARNNAEIHLPGLIDDFDAALNVCDRIIECEDKRKVENDENDWVQFLKQQREARAREWETFLASIEDKRAKVDELFRQKELRLQEYYEKMDD